MFDDSAPASGDLPVIHLFPSPIPPGGQATWSSSGRTLLAALSPSSNSFTAWVAPKADTTARAWEDENGIVREEPVTRVKDTFEPDKAIYMGAWGSTEESLHAVSSLSKLPRVKQVADRLSPCPSVLQGYLYHIQLGSSHPSSPCRAAHVWKSIFSRRAFINGYVGAGPGNQTGRVHAGASRELHGSGGRGRQGYATRGERNALPYYGQVCVR